MSVFDHCDAFYIVVFLISDLILGLPFVGWHKEQNI